MKKEKRRYIFIATLIIIVFIIGIIFKTNSGTLVCTSTSLEDGMMYETKYTATYKNRKVIKVKSVEKITFDDKEMLDDYKSSLEKLYESYNELDHYENNISIKDNTLNSVTTINYKSIDIKELLKLDSSIKNIIDDENNVSVTKIKEQYQSTGASCHYKD